MCVELQKLETSRQGKRNMFGIRKEKALGAFDFLIVGLGNPGKQYEMTRHNAGFLCMEQLSMEEKVKIHKLKFKALVGEVSLDGKRCLLMKPDTFMNNSGEAVRQAADFYHIPPEHILVVFDDVSLPVGKLRLRRKGSAGGHNGIKSIMEHLGSDAFPRVKIGVGEKPHKDYDLAAWVLSRFGADEEKALREALKSACCAIRLIVSGKFDQAMNEYN